MAFGMNARNAPARQRTNQVLQPPPLENDHCRRIKQNQFVRRQGFIVLVNGMFLQTEMNQLMDGETIKLLRINKFNMSRLRLREFNAAAKCQPVFAR